MQEGNNKILLSSKDVKNTDLPLQKICKLDENLTTIGVIKSFDFVDESKFVVANPEQAQVILYNREGSQLAKVGGQGRGPFEYEKPDIVKVKDDKIFIWCSSLRKLLVFKTSGEPLNEFVEFPKGVKDFAVYKQYVCFYTSFGKGNSFIEIFDMNTGEFISQHFGTISSEQEVLDSYECSGGMTILGKTLFYASSDQTIIYTVDLETFKSLSYPIADEEFHVTKLKESPQEIIENPNKAVKYIFGSDIITGLLATDNTIVLRSEVGPVEMEGMQFKDQSKRFQKNYLFDNEMNLKFVLKSRLNEGCSNCLYAADGKYIYNLKQNIRENNFSYELNKVVFDI